METVSRASCMLQTMFTRGYVPQIRCALSHLDCVLQFQCQMTSALSLWYGMSRMVPFVLCPLRCAMHCAIMGGPTPGHGPQLH